MRAMLIGVMRLRVWNLIALKVELRPCVDFALEIRMRGVYAGVEDRYANAFSSATGTLPTLPAHRSR